MNKKSADRIAAGLKRFLPILEGAKSRDVNESDTVVIITDLLAELFGFDKYTEITSEYAIRSTYCDLAIKLDGKLVLLVEVKAIGLTLKENHVKQAIDYAANEGCEWVVLTNGLSWQAYRVGFSKPITSTLLLDLTLSELSPRREADLQKLWLLSKEGLQKSGLSDYHAQREALSRFTLGALLQTAPVLDILRRELRRVTPDAKITCDEIAEVLVAEVIKRECLEGERADSAKRMVAKAASRALKQRAGTASDGGTALSGVVASQQ